MTALAVFSKLNVVGVTLKGIENPADMRSENAFAIRRSVVPAGFELTICRKAVDPCGSTALGR